MYLFPVNPRAGESLSSWRQRLGFANGYRLFPLADERSRRRDQDQLPTDHQIDWLVERTHLSRAQIVDLAPHATYEWMPSVAWGRSHLPWWLAPQYSFKGKTAASQFCPACLTEQSPHFRLSWRFSFTTFCDRHSCLLVDRCHACGAPAWPAAGCSCTLPHDKFVSLRFCARCGEDLAGAPLTLVDTPGWVPPRRRGPMHLSGAMLETTVFMSGVRQLVQFLLRRCRTAPRVTHLQRLAPHLGIESPIASARTFEYLDVQSRHFLMRALVVVLEDWPDRFIEACRRSSILRYEVAAGADLVDWVREPIETLIPGQNRSVTPERLRDAFDRLPQTARTKTALRKRLAWSGDKGLEALFPPARAPTRDERSAIVAELATLNARRRRHFARALNCAALICAISRRVPLDDIRNHSPDAIGNHLKALVRSNPPVEPFSASVQQLLASHPHAVRHTYSARELRECLREACVNAGVAIDLLWFQ